MKFTLKDYQADGVTDVLEALGDARKRYEKGGRDSAISLTAPTGAGKTVMAAAIIEALFFGTDDFIADSDAVVIWFSDNPALNEQSRDRLMQASERLDSSRLVTVRGGKWRPVKALTAGRVYFLNTQQLTKSSLLTRGAQERLDARQGFLDIPPAPDELAWNIWETIGNTLSSGQQRVYLVLDEAHRGFRERPSRERQSIVASLVNGFQTGRPIPIVLGISATIARFHEAMKALSESSVLVRHVDEVIIDPQRVVNSGLLKDKVNLDIPAEAGNFDTVLVRRAARALRDSTDRWARYAKSQGLPEPVIPLMVLQVPNTPDPHQVGEALSAIAAELPGLGPDNVRHVLGGHSREDFGPWAIDWIEPQRVEENKAVRVLIAKDAISTGWDCPRAEVLVSFRPAIDHDHIIQLLGRMIRSPLARRVDRDEVLNSVEVILPFFDKTTAGNVVKYFTGQIAGMPSKDGPRGNLDSKELRKNPQVSESVWIAFDSIPSLLLPKRGIVPMRRLMKFAHELALDGLLPGANRKALRAMKNVLDNAADDTDEERIDQAVDAIWAVRGKRISGSKNVDGLTYADFVEHADDRAIQVAFDFAKKALGPDLAKSYLDRLAEDDDDDSLRAGYVRTAALSTIPEVRQRLDIAATDLIADWFEEFDAEIDYLPDNRRAIYEEIRAQAAIPQLVKLKRPMSVYEPFSVAVPVGALWDVEPAPLVDRNLMSDSNGNFPIGTLNIWERTIISAELKRHGVVGWYRNPSHPGSEVLGIAYRDSSTGNWRSLQPDFLVFDEVDGEVLPSIIDPHAAYWNESLSLDKLKAFCDYAAAYGDKFNRIWAMDMVGNQTRILDLKDHTVRSTVNDWTGQVSELYQSNAAEDYFGIDKDWRGLQ